MTKAELKAAVETFKVETKAALETMYNELNHGQKQKVVKNEKVKALFVQYGVDYSE